VTDEAIKIWQQTAQPDFGDAPDSYGTLSTSNGARHTIVAGFRLGSAVDGESNAQLPLDASGDDVSGLDGEDGVVLQPILVPGLPAAVVVTVVDAPPPLAGSWMPGLISTGTASLNTQPGTSLVERAKR
jgi:hypothetical protein